MPLFKEIEDFNQISLDLKYINRKNSIKEENVFQNDINDQTSIREKPISVKSFDSVDSNLQNKIILKLSKLRGIIDILESNWSKHQKIGNNS